MEDLKFVLRCQYWYNSIISNTPVHPRGWLLLCLFAPCFDSCSSFWRNDVPPSRDEKVGGGAFRRPSTFITRAHLPPGWKSKNRKVYARNSKEAITMESPAKESPVRAGFQRLEVQKTTWDVPERYTKLRPVGSGAYGTVWWVPPGRGGV